MPGFTAHRPATEEHFRALTAIDPRNPFLTAEYAAAQARTGAAPCAFLHHDHAGVLVGGCLALMRGGALSRTLEIVSAPNLPQAFWDGVARFCRRERVWEVRVESYGSAPLELPNVGTPLHRRTRTEYVVDLSGSDPRRSFSTNLRRNLQRAEKNGLVVERTRDPEQVERHVELMDASSQRRAERGEHVPRSSAEVFMSAALASGCAEIFFARSDDEIFSSLLVLRADEGAYYHSAGTSPAGMKLGASTLVVTEAMRQLAAEGAQVFNLGGADVSSEGLRRFKAGFGARSVELPAASFSMVPTPLRKLRTLAKDLRDDPGALLSRLCTVEHYAVYRACPESVSPPRPADSTHAFRKLEDAELADLAGSSVFADQARRFGTLGYNAAYGLFENGELVHVAWLVTPDLDARSRVRNVRLRADEAEITHCETHPSHRGRGLYPIAISQLCRIAAQRGIKTVYMITGSWNESSRHGIERAGLERRGSIARLIFPLLPEAPSVTFRGHRWRW